MLPTAVIDKTASAAESHPPNATVDDSKVHRISVVLGSEAKGDSFRALGCRSAAGAETCVC
jgi:hypothetical protein